MRIIHSIKLREGSKEERLPGFSEDFPYLASRAEIDRFEAQSVQWHWHREIELFYIESGELEYFTPKGRIVFPKGSGGMVNSNILHMTKNRSASEQTVQLLHIFDTAFISGGYRQNSRIEQKYIIPVITASQLEIIAVRPECSHRNVQLLNAIRKSFDLCEDEFGYELKLRAALSDIWCGLLKLVMPLQKENTMDNNINEKIKCMMVYIHEHCSEKITVNEIAGTAFISERECYRIFHDCLRMTPVEYITNYRIQQACHMLAKSQAPVTLIGHSCGLGSSSYFGKIFHRYMGCTPMQYRRKWQDIDR